MNSRVTVRDVANKAKVHYTTVGRALKCDPRIRPHIREKIQKIADDMGYRPDPMLEALSSYRSDKLRRAFSGTLAWLTNYPTRNGWMHHEKIDFHAGAERRAQELGYKLDEIWLREPGMTTAHLTRLLVTRGIQGLLIIPYAQMRMHLRLDWNKFSVVCFNHIVVYPEVHSFSSHYFRSMQKMMRELKGLGYRRPGLALWPFVHHGVEKAFTSAYLMEQHNKPENMHIPLFITKSWSQENFLKWFKSSKPDVVISNDPQILKWLDEMKIKVPEDCGYATIAKHAAPPECSGLIENNDRSGELAVTFLTDMIKRGERGIPNFPTSTLVEGTWYPGNTLRRQNRK